MKTKQLRYASILLIFCLLISGCICRPKSENLISPESLLSSLPKLTTAIQGLVCFPINGEPPLTDEEMIQKVFDDKPELKEKFEGLPISIWHNNRYVIVLIPSPKNDRAWLEDASWTTFVDRLWYQNKTPQLPEFTLIPAVPGN